MASVAVPIVLVGALGSLAMGLPLLYFGVRNLGRSWAIASTGRTPVAELTEGIVEVVGTARPAAGTTASPFTGADCLVVQGTVDEYVGSGTSGSDWHNEERYDRHEPMLVDDGTGAVRVETDGRTDVKLPWERIGGPSSALNPIGKRPRRGKSHRRVQRTVEPGEEVFVRGRAVERPGSNPDPRFEITHPADGPLVVSDSEGRVQGETTIGTLVLLLFGGVLTLVGLVALLLAAVLIAA